jgi:hypothetical protein
VIPFAEQQEGPGMKESLRATRRAAAVGLFLSLSVSAFSATVLVPTLELITHGGTNAGVFELQSYGNMALSVEGGYKFGGNIAFGLSNAQSLENLGGMPLSLDFLSASMTIRDAFSLPVNVAYFIGSNDIFCSGEGFQQFGVAPIMTAYRGYLAFPTGPTYDGIYQVWGTGVHIQYIPKVEVASVDFYAYEDTHPTYPGAAAPLFSALGSYSADMRFLLNLDAVKLEAFVGGTYSTAAAPSGLYRGGLLFYAANSNVEFLAQIGIPLWDPSRYPTFNVNLFYLLVEPRLHLGIISIVPTFFWHPGGYMQAENTSELGAFDVNLNIFAGDLAKNTVQGGVEGNIQFKASSGQFEMKASPWIGFVTPGVVWTAKVSAKLLPFNLADMLEAFVGVRAEF